MFKMYTIVQPEQSNIKDEVFMQCPGQSVYIHIYIYIYIYIYAGVGLCVRVYGIST